MTRKIPIFATIVVLAAVAACIWFGFWQLERAKERDASKELMQERLELPTLMLFDVLPEGVEALYYRRLTANCAKVVDWEVSSGESNELGPGWRYAANCLTANSQGMFSVDMGVSKQPDLNPDWTGGTVTGRGRSLPDNRPISQRIFGEVPADGLMIVAEIPASNLSSSKQPDPSEERNTSWSYAGQWFLFALTALVIYILALRSRGRKSASA